jgi:hypothetical protein
VRRIESRRRDILATVLVAAAATLPGWAVAEPENPGFPRIRGEILVEIQANSGIDANDRDGTLTLESAFSIHLSDEFAIEAGFVLEPVSDPRPGDDRWFGDTGLFVESVVLRWEHGPVSLHAGKFNPAFGFAWDLAPGIYGVDLAEDYEITERIGFGGNLDLGGGAVGRHHLSAEVLFADTSPLSESLVTDRGRTRRSDGGPSNTQSPESFALALRGEAIPRLPGLTYNLGFASQQQGDAGGRTERDAVVGLGYRTSPGAGFDVELLSEYAHLHHAGGEAENRHYFTQSAAVYRGGWNVALSYTGRWIRGRDVARRADFLVQASTGYAREIGAGGRFGILGFDFGWCRAREDGARRDGFGGLIRYALPF